MERKTSRFYAISYGCVSSLEEDWEFVHDIAKEADRRMYASKARYYSDSGIDRRM